MARRGCSNVPPRRVGDTFEMIVALDDVGSTAGGRRDHARASLRRRVTHPRASLRRRSSHPRVSRGVGRGEGISRGYGPFDVAFERPGHGGALRARRGGPAERVREVIGRAVPPRGDARRERRVSLLDQGATRAKRGRRGGDRRERSRGRFLQDGISGQRRGRRGRRGRVRRLGFGGEGRSYPVRIDAVVYGSRDARGAGRGGGARVRRRRESNPRPRGVPRGFSSRAGVVRAGARLPAARGPHRGVLVLRTHARRSCQTRPRRAGRNRERRRDRESNPQPPERLRAAFATRVGWWRSAAPAWRRPSWRARRRSRDNISRTGITPRVDPSPRTDSNPRRRS